MIRNQFWRSIGAFVATAVVGLVLTVSITSGQEKSGKTEKVVLPKKVMDALKTRFPKAVIREQTKETEDNKVVYDIEFTQDSVHFEADIFADGSIDNWEKGVTVKELPEAAMKTVKGKYPKSTIKEIMAITEVKGGKETLEGYEITLVGADKKAMEITVAPGGKILEEKSADE